MNITKTQIANMALGMLGATLLSDFDTDQSTQGQLCRLYYPTAINSMLEDMPWTFGTKRVELTSALQDSPLYGRSYAFELPDDFLQMVETDPEDSVWQIEGHQILSDDSSLGMRYIYAVGDTSLLSAQFVEALSAKLAAMMAMAVTRDHKIAELMMGVYRSLIPTARNRDSQQESARTYGLDSFISVRY